MLLAITVLECYTRHTYIPLTRALPYLSAASRTGANNNYQENKAYINRCEGCEPSIPQMRQFSHNMVLMALTSIYIPNSIGILAHLVQDIL